MSTQATKAKRSDSERPKKPSVARAEIVDKATRARFAEELSSAIKRRPLQEGRLAGAVRVVGAMSPQLRDVVAEATAVMVRRGSFTRELYGASMRTIAEASDRRVPELLKAALGADDAGGTATLSAACFCGDPQIATTLGKLAASRQSHLAFGAETARVCRRESNGAHLTALAPMIKESHRIALCSELFIPLARGPAVSVHVGPALAVLRGAERHLGRWLVLAEVATKAGDPTPLAEALQKSQSGPSSARSAWSLVAWALSETKAQAFGGPPVPAPTTRPTMELVARLSDRPSADRDMTFLFRMARARIPTCKPMLEALAKVPPFTEDVAVRAASFLARDHAREDMKAALVECARTAKREELRGLALAALWDAGDVSSPNGDGQLRESAQVLADELLGGKSITNVAWATLVRTAHVRAASRARLGETAAEGAAPTPTSMVRADEPVASGAFAPDFLAMTETALRWVQWGWLE